MDIKNGLFLLCSGLCWIGCGEEPAQVIEKTPFERTGFLTHHDAAGGNGDDRGHGVSLDANGKILITGMSQNSQGDYDMVIWRFNPDGTLDSSFDGDGIGVYDNVAGGKTNGYGNDFAWAIATDAEGRILVAGSGQNPTGNFDLVLLCVASDGNLDLSFDGDGIVTHHAAAGGFRHDGASSLAVDSSGRIVVGGYSMNAADNRDLAVWRFRSDGALDTTFGVRGFFVWNNPVSENGHEEGYNLRIDGAGRIVVAGYSSNSSGNNDMSLWRLNPDGTLDPCFGGTGYVLQHNVAGGNSDEEGWGVAVDSMERIVVTGYSHNPTHLRDMVLWRFTADGILDSSFGTEGIVVSDGTAGGNDDGTSVWIDPQGRIWIAGDTQDAEGDYDMILRRFTPFGKPDLSFGAGGSVIHQAFPRATNYINDPWASTEPWAMAADPSGNVYLIGHGWAQTQTQDLLLWRYPGE